MLQRVRGASVRWSEDGVPQERSIGRGLVLLVGAGAGSRPADADRLAAKIVLLRVFADAGGRTNLSLLDVGGRILAVSQFTLYADLSRGRRPGFASAGDPARAREIYETLVGGLRARGAAVETGSFGAEMLVSIENDGPMTLVLSTDSWATEI